MMTAETTEEDRDRWIANLQEIDALEPTFVVADHKKVETTTTRK
jgi:hypothetical protein